MLRHSLCFCKVLWKPTILVSNVSSLRIFITSHLSILICNLTIVTLNCSLAWTLVCDIYSAYHFGLSFQFFSDLLTYPLRMAASQKHFIWAQKQGWFCGAGATLIKRWHWCIILHTRFIVARLAALPMKDSLTRWPIAGTCSPWQGARFLDWLTSTSLRLTLCLRLGYINICNWTKEKDNS